MKISLPIIQIAKICHEANRAYCEGLGDDSQSEWEITPEWQQNSAVNGVNFHLMNDVTPEQSHENWMKEKLDNGWKVGPHKDADKKEHPCLVAYSELPESQRLKDHLFRAIVGVFK